jgi:hypothetical protein
MVEASARASNVHQLQTRTPALAGVVEVGSACGPALREPLAARGSQGSRRLLQPLAPKQVMRRSSAREVRSEHQPVAVALATVRRCALPVL